MATARKDTNLRTANARKPLSAGKEHWLNIAEGVALGYRRGHNGAAWYVRFYDGARKYSQQHLGTANDHLDANGETVLTFYQAQEKAREAAKQHAKQRGIGIKGSTTVAEAATHYREWFREHRKSEHSTNAAINAHILPKFGERAVSTLTARELRDWLNRLASKAPRRRTRKGKAQAYGEKPDTDDARRARRATANRIFTILRAILNRAFEDELVSDDSSWRKVKPFKGADEPIIRFLMPAESVRLVNACPAPFRDLVAAALNTGARYSELVTLTAANFNSNTRSVYFRPSKSARGRHVPLSPEGAELFRRLSTGKPGEALLFSRADGGAWGKNHQVRPLTEASAVAKIKPAVTFHELRHTYASTLINESVELPVISKLLGHADTRITMRHYAHLADKTLRAAVTKLPEFGANIEATNVAAIR
jgi:integrase